MRTRDGKIDNINNNPRRYLSMKVNRPAMMNEWIIQLNYSVKSRINIQSNGGIVVRVQPPILGQTHFCHSFLFLTPLILSISVQLLNLLSFPFIPLPHPNERCPRMSHKLSLYWWLFIAFLSSWFLFSESCITQTRTHIAITNAI